MEWFTGLPPGWAYAAAALLLAAEVGFPFGLFVPAATVLMTTGVLAGTGQLDLVVALLATTAGALAGDSVGYWEGRLWGPRARTGRLAARIGRRRWERAESLVRRGGGTAITLGRWTPFVRTLVPRLAGASGIPYARFLPFNAVGVVVWVPGSVLVGYLAHGSFGLLT
jgi:membrane-associated protein